VGETLDHLFQVEMGTRLVAKACDSLRCGSCLARSNEREVMKKDQAMIDAATAALRNTLDEVDPDYTWARPPAGGSAYPASASGETVATIGPKPKASEKP
jgi:hypothetical protein